MQLSLEQLRAAAKRTHQQERAVEMLKAELRKVFGPTLNVDRPISKVIKEVNEILSQTRYRENPPAVRPALTLQLSNHDDPNVRLFAARTIPVRFIDRLAFDPDPTVRHAVAHRAPVNVLDEMVSRWRHDDQLTSIAIDRGLLSEAKEKKDGYKKTTKAVAQWEGPELSEVWYDNQASLLMKKYLNNLEYCWEETAVRQLANGLRSMGQEIDEKKLYDVLKKKIDEREDARLGALEEDPLAEQPLKETLDWLNRGGHPMTARMPVIEENDDPVQSLVDSRPSAAEYVRKFTSLYSVRESPIPSGVRKHRIGEAKSVMKVPVNAQTPHRGNLTSLDERALDKFCQCWNELQQRNESVEPIRIQWNTSPRCEGAVTFEAILR